MTRFAARMEARHSALVEAAKRVLPGAAWLDCSLGSVPACGECPLEHLRAALDAIQQGET